MYQQSDCNFKNTFTVFREICTEGRMDPDAVPNTTIPKFC